MSCLRLLALLATLGLTSAASLAHDGLRQQDSTTSSGGTLRTVPDRAAGLDLIKLDLKVDVEKKTVESKADITFHTLRPTRHVSLDAVGFKVSKVSLGEGETPMAYADHRVFVPVVDLCFFVAEHDDHHLNAMAQLKRAAGNVGHHVHAIGDDTA